MKKRFKNFAGSRPVFTGSPYVEIGGYTVDTEKQNLVEGDVIPEGTLVAHNEATHKVVLVKTGKVKNIDSNDAKIVKLESNEFMNPNFAVGDKVAISNGGSYDSAVSIVAIADNDNDGYVVTLSQAISGLSVGDVIFGAMAVDSEVVCAGVVVADNTNSTYMVTPGLDIAAGDKLYKGEVGSSAIIADAIAVTSYDNVSGKLVTASAITSCAAGDKLYKVFADATTPTKAVTTTKVANAVVGTALTVSPVSVGKDEIKVDITTNTGACACFIRRILPIPAEQLNSTGMVLKANPNIRFTKSL